MEGDIELFLDAKGQDVTLDSLADSDGTVLGREQRAGMTKLDTENIHAPSPHCWQVVLSTNKGTVLSLHVSLKLG